MATRRFANANECDNNDDVQNYNNRQQGDGANKRRTTRHYAPTNLAHHVQFKAFTPDSMVAASNRRKSLRSCKPLPAGSEPPKPLEPDPYLASGQQLPPAIARQLPRELIGKPIEDIDPFYSDQKTFVIISRGKELTRFSTTKALYLLGPFHPIRRIALYILVSSIFNLLVILTIMTNCILMTIQGNDTLEKTEIIFTIVYTTEMGLKVLARGFIIDEFTYLRDPWNWLDYTVIMMAYLTIVIEDLGNLSVMRTFRVLRALKTVAIIPGMKTIVGAVIDSVKNLKDVVVLTLFSLSVFSLLGLQIYMGQLTQKCILDGPLNMSDSEWFNWCNNSSHWIPEPDDEIWGAYRLCGNATGAQSCPSTHTCIQGFGPNPDYGYTNFDTFGWALICSFRLMTQDFWEGLYMQILKTAGSWHIIFFILSIFLGSIYLMNLILAIVAMSYNELQRRAEEEEEAAAEDEAAFLESCRLMELQDELSDVSRSEGDNAETGTCYRPSVEIGLVGQSMLASLCRNGLLDKQMRDKLNEQMIMPNQFWPNADTNPDQQQQHRSHSLCVNLEANEQRNSKQKYASQQPINLSQPPSLSSTGQLVPLQQDYNVRSMASSMTELRRASNRTTDSSSSPTHMYRYLNPMLGGNRHPLRQRLSNKLSPMHVSSGVLVNPEADQASYDDHQQRFSTSSDKDCELLRQRAAIIRIVSDDCSDCTDKQSALKASRLGSSMKEPVSLDSLDPPSASRDSDTLHVFTSKNPAELRRRSETTRTTSISERDEFLNTGLRSRTQSSSGSGFRSKTNEQQKTPLMSAVTMGELRDKEQDEIAVCEQPTPSHPFGRMHRLSVGLSSRRRQSARPTNNRPKAEIDRRCSLASKTEQPTTSDQTTSDANRTFGGSMRTLNSTVTTLSGTSQVSKRHLDIDTCSKGKDKIHLSVENFQQFGATKPSAPLATSIEQIDSTPNQQQPVEQSMELVQRPRLKSRTHINPATMVRSSFSRPRQSIVTMGGQNQINLLNNNNPARRVSRDFVRRASDWSHLSMSANVDLRRLLRLWSHTNPYHGNTGPRSSVGSFSIYSRSSNQRLDTMESPLHSIRAPSVVTNNSPRPSSVSSAWQAYELISALSRRQSRLQSNYRYAMVNQEEDDDYMDKVSINGRDKCIAYCLSSLDILCIWECCGAWLKIQRLIALIVFDPFTELFIILCILINTLFMALDSDDADEQMRSIFERGNYFFTTIFAVEASMKIMALSPKFYFREGWNVFDSIIVGLSLLELGLEGVYGLSVLRSFRLLRVFKLAKSWPTLNLLISIMGKAVGDLGNLTFVLAIIVFIFAVMGMQLFGNKYVDHNFPSGELPRWNFTDFLHSFMIVFRILCAEWIEPMWDCLLVGGWPCIPFFLIAVTVGNLVVLNLFLALLLASFNASNLSSPQADNVDTKKLQEAIGRFSRFGRWTRIQVVNSVRHICYCLLRCRIKKNDINDNINEQNYSANMNRQNAPMKSHIASISRLERLKNIERRTEELKSKIRRSPEHHYHLKQLAQSQLKESQTNQVVGYNFNYDKQCQNSQSANSQRPNIPIIVNVAIEVITEQPDNEYEEGELSGAANGLESETESPSCASSSTIGEFATSSRNQNYIVDNWINQSYNTYGGTMQPIREDSKDAESNNSNTIEDTTKQSSTSLDRTKNRADIAAIANRWRSKGSARNELRKSNDDMTSGDRCKPQESLLRCKSANPLTTSDQEHWLNYNENNKNSNDSLKRPKSSMYLRAPKRQEMEEDDEKALQHIESYIESCICLGIICLKWFMFRQYVRKIVEHRFFDQCILILIVISSGTLALEDKHLNKRPMLKQILDVLDTIFTIIFSLEMIFKWLAFGIRRYFGNIWSWLDFVIVLVSFINLMASIFGSGKIQTLKTMRTLRAMRGLRPLRALQRFQGMRVVVNALIQAIPSIFNVLLVCLIFWLIFSIMGVQMFGGKFWRCLNPETNKVVSFEEAANRIECIERNLTWANPQINFDNVPNAYLALFQVATFKGWIDIMNSATDSRMRDDQPIREANIYMYFYFVFFVIFGSFFTLNLFIGVIIDNFNEQKKKTGGSLEIFMTDDQKKYYHAMKKMRSKRPIKAMTRPKFKLQAYMFDITTSKKFDLVIMIIIGLNMFVMALEHYGQSQEFSQVLENLNIVFIAIFTLECLCKIFALRHFYFREPWNIFDFIVVDLSILGVVMKEYVAKYLVSPTLLRVVRVVKVGRVLRLVKGAKGIRTLLFALAMSLPALFNICLLLFLVMFIYAIFGMSFFMNVRKRSGIDETFNFETFTSSIIVLFQMSTSAGWDLVLDPLMDEENDCQKPDPVLGIEDTCGNKGIAIFYLISYVIVTFLIIINMYIAVILENYSQATEDVQEGLTDDDYEMYYEIWQKFDPNGTQYLPYEKLSDFLDALEDPLRIAKPNDLALVVLDINIYEGNQCYCVDILDAITKYFFTRKGLVIQVNEHLKKVQSILHETPLERLTTTMMLKREHYCAKVIQNSWRQWKQRTMAASKITGDISQQQQAGDNLSNGKATE